MNFRYFGRFTTLIPGLLITVLLFAPGCGDDDPVDPVTDPPFVPSPTPSELMRNFETIYTEELIGDLTDLLHPDFQMILLSDTCWEWGWPYGTTFDKAEMIAIHDNLFSGLPGQDPDGNTIHPVDRVLVGLLELQDAWEPISDVDRYFGGYDGGWGNYRINLEFHDADNSHKFVVQQQVIFYLAEVTIDGNTGYQLLGVRGLPLYQKVGESYGWGDILTVYR